MDQKEHIQKIDTIVIDPDDVIEHFTKNQRNARGLYNERKFKVQDIRGDGPCTVATGVDPRDDGAYYPDSPHPVWVRPSTLVGGWSHDEQYSESHAAAIGLPAESENREIMREETELEEGSDEFERQHEEAMDDWREMWDDAIRKDLKDEITFTWGERVPEMETVRHSVDIRYEPQP